jgi:eukaryotic-like serine/threonine-protein kinase
MDKGPFHSQETLPNILAKPEKEALPSQIGPYKIESLLSKGGMSVLYLGLHPETRKTLAVKVLSPKFVDHPEMIEQFLKESSIISLTDHPNIVKLYGQGKWEGGLYIAMEFIQGVSLKQFIMQQSLSLKRSIEIIMQVAYALCHLHTHGVIHRDLKPENILITESGEVKVIDFGIAQLHTEVGGEFEGTSLMGTPDYMSPEQKKEPLAISYTSDIYSLGIIAYELIIGKLSYGIVQVSLLPKELRKIIEKAIATSPEQRYPDSVNFIIDLTQYLRSGALERDRPGSDQIKEMTETISQAQQSLSPAATPEWPNFDIGLVKYRGPEQIGLYYDWISLRNHSYLFFIAETDYHALDAAIYISVMRGFTRSLLTTFANAETFSLSSFVSKLNELLSLDTMNKQFMLTALHLDCLNDKLSFIACGMGHLLHVAQGTTHARDLNSENPPLGKDFRLEFFEMTDNFNLGDTVVFHSFDYIENPAFSKEDQLENQMMVAMEKTLSLSPQRQAEAILKQISRSPTLLPQKNPKALFTIQRIS